MNVGAHAQFVIYSSPFGTPERLTPEVAERRRVADLAFYERLLADHQLTVRQAKHGPPRINQTKGQHR